MTLRDALQAVYERGGQLTPQAVVEAARGDDEVGRLLHSRFEWNNSVAGEAYRRQQASELIRSVRVVYREATDDEAERSVRAFHAVRDERGHVYEPVERVADDPLTRKMLLRDMEREWRAMKGARYEQFAEFLSMVRADLEEAAA